MRPNVAPASNVGMKRPAGAKVPEVIAARRKYGMKKSSKQPVLNTPWVLPSYSSRWNS